VVRKVFLFEAGPPGGLFFEYIRSDVLEASVRLLRRDVQVLLPVFGQVVEAFLEVLAAVLDEEGHHAFLVDGAGAETQLTGAGRAEEYELSGLAVFLVGAVLTAGRVLGGPRGARVAGYKLGRERLATRASDLVLKDVINRLCPVDLH
jgi:hypothetical protein